MTVSIFITGSTGYIGGSILERLLNHKNKSTFQITTLVRKQEKADVLSNHGVTSVVGSMEDHTLLQEQASKTDVFIEAADCDNLGAAKAVNKGLKQRFEATGKKPILIHTSGTGVFINSEGIVYDDLDAKQLATVADSKPHRNVDLVVQQADIDGYAKTYIVMPGSIYGLAAGQLAKAGYQKVHHGAIPLLIRAALARGQAGVVGMGDNVWPIVHIDDTADLYIRVLEHVLAGNEIGHGLEGYYVGENGEVKFGDISKAVGEAMLKFGKSTSAEPTRFTDEEVKKFFGAAFLATNCHARANRSQSIGWKPTHTTADILASVYPEMEEIVASGNVAPVIPNSAFAEQPAAA